MRWTDERLDDLNKKVDDGFNEMRAEFRMVRAEMGGLHRLMIQLSTGMFLTMILGFAGLVVAMLNHG
ncbi:MAG: hypothetical protein JST08_05610 [Actinobacteria bacterium]|nr:hypothetical protein [Actinomycetota bacterium]